jgi:hypothetical protein
VAFTAQSFMTLAITKQVFVDNSCSEFHPNPTENIENMTNFHLQPKVKYACHSSDFHEIQAQSLTFCKELLHHIS